MDALDVRDLRGRANRLLLSIVVGVAGSFGVTLALPTRDHFPTPPGGCGYSHWDQGWLVEGGSLALMLVGAVVIALGAYAVLSALARKRNVALLPRRVALPRAIVQGSR